MVKSVGRRIVSLSTPGRYLIALLLARRCVSAVRLCLSSSVSACHKTIASKQVDGLTAFLRLGLPSAYSTLCFKETWLSPKLKVLSSGTPGLEFRYGTWTAASVVDLFRLTTAASLSTLSPCLCTQRDWCNAARRAGPPVTAETCHRRHCHHRKLPTAPIHFLARHDNEKAIAPQIQAMRLTTVRVIKCLYV